MRFLVAACFLQSVFLLALAYAIGGTLKEVRECATRDYVAASLEPRDKVLIEAAKRLAIPLEVGAATETVSEKK